jgi:predicted metal-dependent RNase
MANREDLLDLVGKVEPRTVLLSHGEADSLTWFTAQIHARYPKIKIVQPKPGVAVEV